jgi:DNA-directed RNA polymerase subunit RPC12/RpoP
MFLAWASLVGFVSLLVLAPIGIVSDVRSLLIADNAIFLSTGALFLFFAFSIRCPKCMRHLLIQGTEQPTPAEKTKWVNGWSIALKAARNHDFRCMHCGQRFLMKQDTLRSAANT